MKGKVFACGAIGVGVTVAALAGSSGLGAQAAQDVQSVEDTIEITIEPGCTFIAEPDDATMRAVTIGQGAVVEDIDGVTFKVTCNGRDYDGTWSVTAQGQNEAKMSDGAGHEFASTDGNLSGESSNWAMKMNVTGEAQITEGYLDYTKVPTEEVIVAKNRGEKASGDATIQAQYGVSAQSDQEAGSYKGQVIYTLSNSPSE